MSLFVWISFLIVQIRFPGIALACIFFGYLVGSIYQIPGLNSVAVFFIFLNHGLRCIVFNQSPFFRINLLDCLVLAFLLYACVNNAFISSVSSVFADALAMAISFSGVYIVTRLVFIDKQSRRATELLYGLAVLGSIFAAEQLISPARGHHEQFTRFTLEGVQAVAMAMPLPYVAIACVVLLLNLRQSVMNRLLSDTLLFVLILCLAVILIVTFANATRGALLSFLAAAAILLVYRLKWSKLASFSFIFIFTYLIMQLANVLPVFMENPLLSRLARLSDPSEDASASIRLHGYDIALEMFYQRPFFGHGSGSFHLETGLGYVHNLFLELLSESGIFGTLIFTSVLYVCVSRIISFSRATERIAERVLSDSVLVFFVVALVHQQMSFSIEISKGLAISIAICASLSRRRSLLSWTRGARSDDELHSRRAGARSAVNQHRRAAQVH